MNVIFLSPHFPPNFCFFCLRLRQEGANVLGIGDCPYHLLSEELRRCLTEYYYVPDMKVHDAMLRAVAYFIHRYGRIHRIDSLNEYWLGVEAMLREDFNIFGQRLPDLEKNRRKLGMYRVFQEHQIPCPLSEPVENLEQMTAFAQKTGYPLVLKPDVGVGASGIFKVGDAGQLASLMSDPPQGYLVQEFIPGTVCSFDGLTDRAGNILFFTAHEYSSGVMEIVHHGLKLHYFSYREMPLELETLGRRIVAAFHVKERFFHVEFFLTPDRHFVAIEINVRPPGGFSLDMMNFACDIDLYHWWAKLIVQKLENPTYERKYHSAHACRRQGWHYRFDHDELLRRLGDTLAVHVHIPHAFSVAMGDEAYILRHPDLGALKEAIAWVEETL